MLPSGYLIRPCDGGGSIIHIVDHIDLDVSIKINQLFGLDLISEFDSSLALVEFTYSMV